MVSDTDIRRIESHLKTATFENIDIGLMGDDANIYYEITDTQSSRHALDGILIGKEPTGYDYRSKLMLYKFGDEIVLVVDDPQERQDIRISGMDLFQELTTIAGRMIEFETHPVRIEVFGGIGESVAEWAVETYDDKVEIT